MVAAKIETESTGPLGKTIIDDVIMVVLALVSVFLLVFEIHAAHTPEQMQALEAADSTIALIFLVEFCVRFACAENRVAFVRRHGWELLASIPINSVTTQALRSLNLLRVFRLVRLLRLIRFLVRLKIILQASSQFAERTYLIYISTVAGIVIMSGALGFHYLEAGANPNVHSL